MNLYEAVYQRHSVRKYKMEAIDPERLSKIGAFYEQIEPLFPGIETEIGIKENVAGKHICRGFFGVTAPYYLTVYSEKRDRAEMNAGYLCEQISLYMLTLGIGSCYLGASIPAGTPKVRSDKALVISMAFGIPAGRLTRRSEDAKRLPVKELCVYKDPPTRWMTQVIEAARLAPSSMNRQPWRFVAAQNRIHIFSKKDGMDKPKKWDEFNFGVMFAHIAIASEELWLDVDLIKLENISQKNFRSNQYVLSAIVREQEQEREQKTEQKTEQKQEQKPEQKQAQDLKEHPAQDDESGDQEKV